MNRLTHRLALVFFCFVLSIPAFGLESLSNESLATITARAVSENPGFDLLPDITLPSVFSEQALTAYSHDNTGIHKSVIVDFIGSDARDVFGNTYRKNFNATVEADNVVYQNYFKDTYSFVVFEGTLKGMTTVPEYYDHDPTMRNKTLAISRSRIDLPEGLTGDYLCSYQGNLFSRDAINDQDQTFLIYPNRQTITTGRAESSDLAILLPSGTEGQTVWKPVIKSVNPQTQEVEYLVIPEGERYVHISLNHMVTRTDIHFKLRLSHGKTPWAPNDDENLPRDIGQTLGTFHMSGGSTTVNGGNVLITVNESL